MASLPKTPFVDIDSTRVAVDAPVSTDLWQDTVVNENYLKAVLSDGAAAPQDIVTNNVTITGTLTVGTFVVPETALIFLPLWD